MTKPPKTHSSDLVTVQVSQLGMNDRQVDLVEIEAAARHAVERALHEYDVRLLARVREISNGPRWRG